MNKKTIWIILGLIILAIVGICVYNFALKDDNSALSVDEKKWIEENKNKVIDLSITNDIPILNVNGEGLLFDFLSDLEKETGLEFNKLSYSEDALSDYSFGKVNTKNKDDILIYRDNYVLLTKTKKTYNKISDIKDLVIGVYESEIENVNTYLDGSSNVAYKTFSSTEELFNALSKETVNAIVVPKIENFNTIAASDEINIAYNITQYTNDYVFSLGKNEQLNEILVKYYNNWEEKKYNDSFYKYFSENYFSAKEIDEKEKAEFRSKRYTYGFVINNPFDVTTNEGLKGLNYGFLKNFVKAANIEIDYKKYSSYEKLLSDFNSNNLDIMFAYQENNNYRTKAYETSSVYDEKVVIVSSSSNHKVYSSISSLKDVEVKTIEGSKISAFLKKKNVDVIEYSNSNDLISHLDQNKDVLALDYYTYDYNVRESLKKFKIDNEFYLEKEYNFVCRDISKNKIFNEFFDFYLTFTPTDEIISDNYADVLSYTDNDKIVKVILSLISAFLILLLGIITFRYLNNHKKHKVKLSKADKLRYVDTLTSLKNRNYLNANVEKWDNSEVYPQSIIIVDLNNVAYVNDNFGHTEGDKVIVEAAGILINNQISNSEIIRTSGNEFLIYTVGHDEKDIITYCRKLNKELKKLSHGFGAATGYSMITDGIKTVDDAVNEATIAMKNAKGDIN